MSTSKFQAACDELRTLGITLRYGAGEYRVNFLVGDAGTEFMTDDFDEAVKTGREMAANPAPRREPPLGPLGPRSHYRSRMYRHNRRVEARRRRKVQNAARDH